MANLIPITGTIRDAMGNLFNGIVRFILSYGVSHHLGTNQLVLAEAVAFPVTNGTLPSGSRITPNDVLHPANTTYTAQYVNRAGDVVAQNVFYITGSSFDIGQAIPTPITTSNISFDTSHLPFDVQNITAGSIDADSAVIDTLSVTNPMAGLTVTNFTATTATLGNAGITSLSNQSMQSSTAFFGRINNVRYPDLFAGANAGVKIVAAIADLPSTGGIVDCRGLEGTQTLAQNIFAGLSNRPIRFLCGATQFHVQVTQTISLQEQVRLIGTDIFSDGATNYQTSFIWDGTSGGTVLLLDCVRDSIIEGLAILPGSGTVGIGIRIDHVSTPTGAFHAENDRFYSCSIGPSTTAIQIGNTSVMNNSEHVFEDIDVYGTGTYGYYINDLQSKQMKILRGHIRNRTYGVYTNKGSFTAENICLSGNGQDFSLGSVNDIILIKGCESENSSRFLSSQGASYSPWCVTLLSNSYVPNLIDSGGYFIFFGQTGGLTLIGNDFSGSGNYVANANIFAQGTNPGAGRVVSIGNTYPNANVFTQNPNASTADIVSLGDDAWTAALAVAQLPNLLGNGYNGALTLANGANNDIATSGGYNTAEYCRISGPTAAFSVSGFTGGTAGRTIRLFNTTAQAMTIKNLTGSVTANQIQTLTGADVVLRTGTSFASFIYDASLSKWILTSSN